MFQYFARKRKEEGITSFMFYFLLFPIFIMVFGYGVDTAMSIYVRNTLQQSLDTATLSVASQTPNNPLGNASSRLILYNRDVGLRNQTLRDLYDANRSGTISKMLVCPTSEGIARDTGYTLTNAPRTTINRNPSGVCYQTTQIIVKRDPVLASNRNLNITRTSRYIEVRVVEYSRNNFIGIFIPQLAYQKYEITSRAALTLAQN
jgi:Flp pilus assembly protein TadG